MRRVISLLLAAILMFGLLAGCQTEEGLPPTPEKALEIKQAYIRRTGADDYTVDDLTLRSVWCEDGIYAVYVDGPFGYTQAVRDVVIGEYGNMFLFTFQDGQRLYIYKDDSIYTLEEAYAADVLKTEHWESLNRDGVYKNIRPAVIQPADDALSQTTATEGYPMPPYWVSFSSMEEYKAFVEAADLPQEDLLKFLDKNSYNACGIKGREDIIQVRDFFAEFPFPHLKGARLTTLLLSVEGLQVTVRYELNDGVSATYRLNIWEDSAEKELEEYIGENPTLAEKMDAENYTELYCLGNWLDDPASFSYGANINGHLVRITVLNSTREYADEIVRNTTFGGM